MKKSNVDIILSSPAQQNPAMIYLAGLPKESSRIVQRYDLDTLARKFGALDCFSFDWAALRFEQMTMIQTWLLETYKPRTAARIMCAVKGCLKAAHKMRGSDGKRLMDEDSYEDAIDLPTIKKGKSITGRALTFEEIAALMETCRTGPPLRGTRDAAIIILMCGCGLRENEVTNLSLADYNPASGDLMVHGKGGGKDGKLRPAYLTNGTRRAMEIWLSKRGDQPGPLFTTIFKSDELTLVGMSNISVWYLLKNRAEKAGVAKFTPHDLRRTFASEMLSKTDLATVAKLMGHEDVSTTAAYDRRGIQHTIDAAALLSIPFTPREDGL